MKLLMSGMNILNGYNKIRKLNLQYFLEKKHLNYMILMDSH